jgi:hypothetical protein
MKSQKREIVNFCDVKDAIVAILEKKWQSFGISEEYVSIIDGFFNPTYSDILTDQIILGGPTVPMIMVVGKTGRVYLFAYKALIQDEDKP